MKITYRGWAGHFCCSQRCKFRLNTLIEHNDTRIVVSTVGLMVSLDEKRFEKIGFEHYFETMVFHAEFDGEFWDANVEREIYLDTKCTINDLDGENQANQMHYDAEEEVCKRILDGELA